MGPLRSSRSTRNQDHQAASRNRGIIDLDPTEGLPVQKWEQISIKINQDPSTDLSAAVNNLTGALGSTSEWSAQFNTPQFPWPESALPSFFSQLPSWNQEMLRRARAGNTKPKMSEWDRKNKTWISASEVEKRSKKAHHIEVDNSASTNNATTNGNNNASGGVDENGEHDDDEDHEDHADDDMDVDNDEDTEGPNRAGPVVKRRKHSVPEERTIAVKRWTQVPLAVAEKTEERKFLADRRAGMPSLYGGTYQNQVFQPLGLSQIGYTAYGTSNASYDLGDGAGLGTALGGPSQEQVAPAPVRKNMPPKRKKKKGGPGRKKANPNPDVAAALPQINGNVDGDLMETPVDGVQNTGQIDAKDVSMQDGDEDAGSESGDSEDEGSEEGEIEEVPEQHESTAVTQNEVQTFEPAVTALSNPLEPSLVSEHITIENDDTIEPPEEQPEPIQLEKVTQPMDVGPTPQEPEMMDVEVNSASIPDPVPSDIVQDTPAGLSAVLTIAEQDTVPPPAIQDDVIVPPTIVNEPVTQIEVTTPAAPTPELAEPLSEPIPATEPVQAIEQPLPEQLDGTPVEHAVSADTQPKVLSEEQPPAPEATVDPPLPEPVEADPQPAPIPEAVQPPQPETVPEQDLLGGLEDQVNKDIEEQA